MDSKEEKEELLEIWAKFLNTTTSEEGEVWLDAFLAKFLHLASKETKEKQLKLTWKNASNSLAHQFLFDVHRICSDSYIPPDSIAESCDVEDRAEADGDNDDDDMEERTSAYLQKYLLDGRGWKLLWCLELLGIENLSCAKDLVELLVSHIPVAIVFPVYSSTAPEAILKRLSSCDGESIFILTKTQEALRNATGQQLCAIKSRTRRSLVKMSKGTLRQRMQKRKERLLVAGGSSSENEVHIQFMPRTNAQELQHDAIMKGKCFDVNSLHTVYPSETDELDSDFTSSSSALSCDQVVSDFKKYSLSTVDYISFVLRFLEKIAKSDHKNVMLCSLCCPLISEFSLNALRNVREGFYCLDGWSELQIKCLRNQLLRLLFFAVSALKCIPGKVTEASVKKIVETVIPTSSSIIASRSLNENFIPEDASFLCDVASGVLAVITSIVKTCSNDHGQIIRIVRTFSEPEVVSVFCSIITYSEKSDSLSYHSSSTILYMIKSLIYLLKNIRAHYSHQEVARNFGPEPQNLNDVPHHHSDALGSGFSHTLTRNVPVCCVATMSHLLLKIYSCLTSDLMRKSILKCFRECGTCCCMDQDYMLDTLFSQFEKSNTELQQFVLSVLEKTIYPQLGMVLDSSSWCPSCEKRKHSFRNSPNMVSNFSADHLGSVSGDIMGQHVYNDGTESLLPWRSLNIYCDLLTLNDVQSTGLVTKHLAYLLLHGADYIKNEVFMRAVLPDLLKLVFELRSRKCLSEVQQVRIDCFLSLLPAVLCSNAELDAFIHFGGIRILYELLFFPSMRLVALESLKVLIIIEIESHTIDTSGLSKLYSSEPMVSNCSTAMMTFSDILCQYSKLFLQKLNRLNPGNGDMTLNRQSTVILQTLNSGYCSHLNGFKLLSNGSSSGSDDSTISSNDELVPGLMFLCDLWTVCKEIVLKVPSGSNYLCTHAVWDSYNLFTSLLQNLRKFMDFMNRDHLDRVFHLVENLLTLFLFFKESHPGAAQRLPGKEMILNTVRTFVEDYKSISADDLQQLLHCLLQCCLFCCSPPEDSLVSVKKTVVSYITFASNWENSATSSESSELDAELMNSSYDGDSERSDTEDTEPSTYRAPYQSQRIQHSEVIKLVIDLLLHYKTEMELRSWVQVSVHIIQMIIRLCHSHNSNIAMLSKKGFCSDLLKGFFDVMKQTSHELEGLQKALLELFSIVAHYSVSAEDLKMFIELFKSPSPPYDMLVATIKALLESATVWPSHVLPFPCAQTRLKIGRAENKQRMKQCLQIYNIYYNRRMNNASLTPWGCMSAIFPLAEESKLSSLKRSFSFTVWLMVKRSGKMLSVQDECSRSRSKPVSADDDGSMVFHVLSVGSDVLTFEMWINTSQGDIVFRSNEYVKEEAVCLAEETCHNVLKPGKWHYISVSYCDNAEISTIGKKTVSGKVHLLVDGVKETHVQLEYEDRLPKNNTACFVFLGHSTRQTKKQIAESFYIGNFMLFKGDVLSRDTSYYISSLGPCMNSISKCALENQKIFFPPKFDVNSLTETDLNRSLLNGMSVPSLEQLQKSLLLSYSAEKPMMYALYPQSVGILLPLLAPFAASGSLSTVYEKDWPAQQEPSYCKLVVCSRLSPIQITNIYTAVHRFGGVTVLMFLFARVVESCDQEETLASALQLLLHLIMTDSESADHFLKISGDQVLLGLLTSSKLVFSHHILKVFLDVCVNTSVMKYSPWKNTWSIDYKSEAIICRPFLWSLLTKCVFLSENCPVAVQVNFISVVRLLLRPNHPHLSFNLEQMRLVNMLELVVSSLKYHYVLSDESLPVEVAVSLPQVIKGLLAHPMDVQQLWLICNLLLLLHQASDTYVCHAKSSFFFLLEQKGAWHRRKLMKSSLSVREDASNYSSTESTRDSFLGSTRRRSLKIQRVKSMTDLSVGEGSKNLKRVLSLTDVLPNVQKVRKSGSWLSVLTAESSSSDCYDSYKNSNFSPETELDGRSRSTEAIGTEGFRGASGGDGGISIPDAFSLSNQDMLSEEFYLIRKKKDVLDSSKEKANTPAFSPDYVEIYVGLLNVVTDVISHSSSETKQLILEVVKPEIFVVLAYNGNPRICSAVLEVINSYLQKSPEEKIADFVFADGFHMLANQLHLLPVDPLVAAACFNFMFFGKHAVEDLQGMTPVFAKMLSVHSWIPLLSILPNTVKDVGLCNSILSALGHQLMELPEMISEMMSKGLAESLVLCLTKSLHSSQSPNDSVASLEKNRILKSVLQILRMVSSNLFSSRSADDFSSFTSLLQLFFQVEIQCHKQCGPSALCVTSFRDCQCVVFQAAIDFIDVYNYRRIKDNRSDIGSSVWEILISMPDNLNPYSTFLSSNSTISSDSRNADFTISHSYNTLQNAEKANKELPMSVAVDRFRFILSVAADFVVFQDTECVSTDKQKTFFQSLFHSVVKGLSTMMGKSVGGSGSKWSAVIWSVKDTLRLEVSRLLVYTLAQCRDIEQKCFVLETLADQRRCTEILTTVLFSVSKVECLPIFLYNMYKHRMLFSQKQRNDFNVVYSYLKRQLDTIDFGNFGNEEYVQKFTDDWQQLWNQDRQKWLRKQLKADRITARLLEKLADKVSIMAMDVTKRVVGLQSVERKKFMEEVKLRNSEEVAACETWQSLVEQFTHERAIWHVRESYPLSWELDPTEGPLRIRKRLRRCYLNLEPRFVMQEFRKSLEPKDVPVPFISLLERESGIPDSSLVLNKLHVNEKIEYTCPCKVVMPLEEVKGELLIGDTFLHFIEESKKKQKLMSERWPFINIKEILPRRFELRNNAFEMFMKNGLTFLIAFFNSKDLEEVWKRLQNHRLPCMSGADLASVTQLWLDRSITNFEYLTHLNKFAGRSFNDLMQYPVFPFILANYSSQTIDLNDSSVFRNLAKPIAIQNKEREEYYIKSYNALKDEQFFGPWSYSEHVASGPFHYGSHYSNSGIVLHFLVRLLPYTYGLIQYQDNNFDIPDRTFHSINTSWQLVTKNSPSDVRELVPEFFFLPEFLCNREGFDFGLRQSRAGEPRERVNDVQLPPWCEENPRLFVLIHRQALESNHVTNNLKHWIDLVFGYKQTGKAAVEAINIFHPATYFGMDISKVEDHVTREALKATIKTVGQMPKQLFHDPHPNVPLVLSEREESQISRMKVLENVDGLKWGDYVGSPSTGTPNMVWRYKQSISVGRLLPVYTNDVFGLQQNVSLLLSHSKDKSANMLSATYIRSAALISWLHEDGIVRIKFCRDHPPVPLLKSNNMDPICLCASDPDCNELFVAHDSGIITVYHFSIDSSKSTVTEEYPPVQLNGHSGVITSICICKAFSIAVTGSEDKTCIIWDLNKLCYVRSIVGHTSAVKLVCVSNTLGEIASVSDSEKGSCLKVHTINGELVGSIQTSNKITALCYSTASEGVSVNVIATGMNTGSIRLWSSWNLKLVREIRSEKFIKPITCIAFSVDSQHLYAANTDGTVAVWEKPSKMLMSMPRFLMFT